MRTENQFRNRRRRKAEACEREITAHRRVSAAPLGGGASQAIRLKFTAGLFLAVLGALAQPPVAPSPTPAGSAEGASAGAYNVTDSFELGFRFRTVGGSFNQYRGSVNLGNGIRLLGGSTLINSKDGRGTLFDRISLTTQGLGNDPYESSRLRVERNRTYRYEMSWRRNDYFNPGLVSDGGVSYHEMDTRFTTQDHDLTLFPQSNYKFFLGFSGSSQTGPAYVNEGLRPGIHLVDVNRRWNEYRVGSEFKIAGIRVNWMHGWEDFKEDNAFSRAPAGVPDFPQTASNNPTSITKADPDHGTNPYWRVALFQNTGRTFSWNGRFTYTAGRRAFALDETFLSANRNGVISATRAVNNGDAQRPVATGNLNLVFTPASKLTISNISAFYNSRTMGETTFAQLSPGAPAFLASYNYLRVRTFSNDATVNYQWTKMVGLFASYHYSDRLIASRELSATTLIPARQTDILNAESAGVRLRPAPGLTVQLGGEVGRSNRPFTPVAPRNYVALNGRIQYRVRNFQLLATTNTDYNNNSVAVSSYSSHSRRYAADGSWTPRPWFWVNAGYSKMHLDSAGGLAYRISPPAGTLYKGDSSLYFSNLHTVTSSIRFAVKSRLEIFAGLTRVQDTGDGRATAAGALIGSIRTVFQVVQTYPLTFVSPSGRVSLKLTSRLRWNAGYQYYGYRQEFNSNPYLNYQANTGYTSLSCSF